MPTFTLDAFAGKSRDQLHADCRRLLSMVSHRECVIKQMIVALGDGVRKLPEPARTEAERLIEAFKD